MDTRAPTIDDLLRIAKEDIARSSLSSAERALEQAVLIDSQSPDAFHLLGQVYAKKGRFKKAILCFERALTLDPFHTEAAIALSALYNDVGKYKEGAAVFLKTKQRLGNTLPGHDPRINQSLSEKHYELGLFYSRFERFQEAHHEFAKALNLHPEHVEYAMQMARCLAKAGDKEGAVRILQKSLEKNPKRADAHIQLGIMMHSLQRLKEARQEWQHAPDDFPQRNVGTDGSMAFLLFERRCPKA